MFTNIQLDKEIPLLRHAKKYFTYSYTNTAFSMKYYYYYYFDFLYHYFKALKLKVTIFGTAKVLLIVYYTADCQLNSEALVRGSKVRCVRQLL